MYDQIVKLIKKTEFTKVTGDITATMTTREVLAEVKSVGMKEKYQALSVGLYPELVIVLADYLDYNNETQVEYDNVTYDVIRIYRKAKELEMVVSHGNS